MTFTSRRIERVLLRDRAVAEIRSAILSGRLRPGSTLRDADLIRWLGMSRTPVREALLALGSAGLVDLQGNRAARVADAVPANAISALQTLGVFMRGVLRTSPDQLLAARPQALAMIDTAVLRVEYEDRVAIDRTSADEYHRWADLCQNPVLAGQFHGAIDGLAFRLRGRGPGGQVPWLHVHDTLLEFRHAVDVEDGTRSVSAIERMHMLDRSPIGESAAVA